MSDEERAMEILRAVVNAMRSTGADGGDVLATCRRIVADIRAEEREACAKLVPTSWLDPMFVGAPNKLDCPSVEWVSRKIAAAIRARGQS